MKRILPIINKDDLPIMLAPMAGYTNFATRRLISEISNPIMITEMVSTLGLYYGDKKTNNLTKVVGNTGIQIFGHDPKVFSEVIKKYINNRQDIKFIDINFGCPAPKIVKNGDGSKILENTELLYEICKASVKASEKPVSAKIRLGYYDDSKLYDNVKAIEEAGISFLTIHGRTKEMFYSGNADWEKIFEARNKVSIPVIGNGDIKNAKNALEILEKEIDGVAIGRAAIENPFIFLEIESMIKGSKFNYNKRDLVKTHFDYLLEERREEIAVNEFKKFLSHYIRDGYRVKELRTKLSTFKKKEDIYDAINYYFDKIDINEYNYC